MFVISIQNYIYRYPSAEFYVYTGDIEVTPIEITQRVRKNMNVAIQDNVKFVYLNKRKWIEAKMYPYFTLFCQSMGSVYLAFEALRQFNPGMYKAI